LKIVKYFGIPGSGKTRKLMELVEADVAAGIPLKRIGYLSFTKGAAEVIRDRMKATPEDMRNFRTIHSACMSLLGIGRENVIVGSDYHRFRELTGMDVRSDEFDDWDTEKPLDFTPTKRALELACATMQPIENVIRLMPPHVNLTRERTNHFVTQWEAYKSANDKFDFTDMLTKYLEAPVPMDVDVIYLDEAQDLSALQWVVFKHLIKNAKRVVMAGDDDQAIYSFIGGSEYGFLDYPADEEIVLGKSWRVPVEIGHTADSIIRKVGHRKPKHSVWQEKPGDVQRMNLDAFTLPWRSWMQKYPDILVLTRHRKGARDFSDDLKSVGVPHDLNGDGLASWKEAKYIETFLKLRNGGDCTVHQATMMLNALNLSISPLKGMRPRQRVTRALLPFVSFEESQWVGMFAGDNPTKIKRYEAIRQLVNNEGVESLAKKPSIRVKTMHAAKGDEADLVVIVPDCMNIVTQNIMTPAEIRLAYVAMTRALHQTVVLIPRSDQYITHFFGG
jgi:superfamily I DNA/RNA helicase